MTAAGGWLTPEAVAGYSGIKPADTFDEEAIANATAAAAVFVQRVCVDRFPTDPDGVPDFTVRPDEATYQGALLLGARWYGRRTSQNGIAAFTELGGATLVPRYDSDIEQLLRIGSKMVGGVG